MMHRRSGRWSRKRLTLLGAVLWLAWVPCARAQSPDDLEEFRRYREEMQREFSDFKKEFEEYKRIVEEERARFLEEIGKTWDDPKTSSEKVWVEYSDDLQERRSVDFESERVSIEVTAHPDEPVDEEEIRKSLEALVAKTADQAFRDDRVAQAVEERSKQEISLLETAEVPPEPILLSYLTGLAGRVGSAVDYVAEIVDHMMTNRTVSSSTNARGETVQRAEFPLEAPPGLASRVRKEAAAEGPIQPPAKLPARAASLWSHVKGYAREADVDEALVYAVIETESAFDPMATSHIPAYGLMQIVPGSAGLDVTKELFGKERILAPSYLYVARNNIQAGATYLKILYHRYLQGITDPTSRLYCAVAAYNTGAGNVARAFTGRTRLRDAVQQINGLSAEDVYARLRESLPHDETRRYVEKVRRLMRKYQELGV